MRRHRGQALKRCPVPRPEKSASAVRPEGDSKPRHFLEDYYHFRMPDFSDETKWTIGNGRAWPALVAVFSALWDQERRGTEESRADARGGRLTIGIKALARMSKEQDSKNIQTTAILRQLRFLQRAGILKMHDGERLIEIDPETGKIVRGRGRTPPKVIIMTLQGWMMRGSKTTSKTGSNRSQRPEETGSNRSLRPRVLRDTKCPPSRETTSTEVVSYGNNRGREHPARGGRSLPPPQAQKQPAAGRPAEELSADEQANRARQEHSARLYAKALGITYDEVVSQWKSDHRALLGRLEKAGIDWRTGKAAPLTAMIDGPPAPPPVVSDRMKGLEALKEGERYVPSTASTFAVRRQTTDSLTVCPSIAGEAAQALYGPPVSEEERKAIILRDLAQAGLTAGEARAGAGAA